MPVFSSLQVIRTVKTQDWDKDSKLTFINITFVKVQL